jgi:hypothetical protein
MVCSNVSQCVRTRRRDMPLTVLLAKPPPRALSPMARASGVVSKASPPMSQSLGASPPRGWIRAQRQVSWLADRRDRPPSRLSNPSVSGENGRQLLADSCGGSPGIPPGSLLPHRIGAGTVARGCNNITYIKVSTEHPRENGTPSAGSAVVAWLIPAIRTSPAGRYRPRSRCWCSRTSGRSPYRASSPRDRRR